MVSAQTIRLHSFPALWNDRLTHMDRTEDALRTSEERFRTICEHAPVMIDSFDEQGRCTLWNRECVRVLGYTEDEIRACDDPLSLFYPNENTRASALADIQRADGTFNEYNVRTKAGAIRIQLWANFRLPDGGLISVGHDVTDIRQGAALKKANEELERSQMELRKSQARLLQTEKLASLGKMSAGIAHEINNPLQVVKGYAEQLRLVTDVKDADPRVSSYIDKIERSCKRMEKIVSQMSDYSRTKQPTSVKCSVNGVICDVAKSTAEKLAAKAIHLDLDLCPENPLIAAAAIRVDQLLVNLIDNARGAIAEKPNCREGEGRITISTVCSATEVEIRVADNGIGIRQSDLPKIFDPFYSTKPPGSGTGLGLSIVHEVVQEMSGTITCRSTRDVGTTMVISIPR